MVTPWAASDANDASPPGDAGPLRALLGGENAPAAFHPVPLRNQAKAVFTRRVDDEEGVRGKRAGIERAAAPAPIRPNQ